LRNKLDKVQQDIHGPVPHYATDLAEKVNRFFDPLPPEHIVSRRNWSFSPHPPLFVPDRSLPDPPSLTGVEDLRLRSERQTLRKLPVTGEDAITATPNSSRGYANPAADPPTTRRQARLS